MRILSRWLLASLLFVGMLVGSIPQAAAQDSWAVYIYMCGSDLESDGAWATNNLNQIKSVQLPENVKVFIQTGGSKEWHTSGIPDNALGRYVYDQTGFHEIAKLPDASMGDEETLQNFLSYAKENFPADHRMLVFWDHGGGSLYGFCTDDKYGTTLSLKDLRQALMAVDKANPEQPLFDLVSFDTCLMATLDTANALDGYARYLVASEELMPSSGTDYAGWLGALAQKPVMDGRELGTIICEKYLPYCEQHEADDIATLSLLDMSKVPKLNTAYEAWGREALQAAKANPRMFYTAYDRLANGVENYGQNFGPFYAQDDVTQWTNMLDLGALAQKMTTLKSAAAFNEALKDAIVCRVYGPYRQHGTGLAGYYCLDGKILSLTKYTPLPGASQSFADFYGKMLAGSGDGISWYQVDMGKIADAPIVFDENNVAAVTLAPEEANSISRADFILASVGKDGSLLYYGGDDRLAVDWEKGIFKDDFDCTWPALNGHFLAVDIDEMQSDYILFHSYILLNGKKCFLNFAYNRDSDNFSLMGAHRLLDDGVLDREVRQLKKGDKITLFFNDEEGKEVKGESFILEQDPVVEDKLLPDGQYAFAFRFIAPRNENVYSQTAYFAINEGKVVVN